MRKIAVRYVEDMLWLVIEESGQQRKHGPVYLKDVRRLLKFADNLVQDGDDYEVDDVIIERMLVWHDYDFIAPTVAKKPKP